MCSVYKVHVHFVTTITKGIVSTEGAADVADVRLKFMTALILIVIASTLTIYITRFETSGDEVTFPSSSCSRSPHNLFPFSGRLRR